MFNRKEMDLAVKNSVLYAQEVKEDGFTEVKYGKQDHHVGRRGQHKPYAWGRRNPIHGSNEQSRHATKVYNRHGRELLAIPDQGKYGSVGTEVGVGKRKRETSLSPISKALSPIAASLVETLTNSPVPVRDAHVQEGLSYATRASPPPVLPRDNESRPTSPPQLAPLHLETVQHVATHALPEVHSPSIPIAPVILLPPRANACNDPGCRACKGEPDWVACPVQDCKKHQDTVQCLNRTKVNIRCSHMRENHSPAEVLALSGDMRKVWGVRLCLSGKCITGVVRSGGCKQAHCTCKGERASLTSPLPPPHKKAKPPPPLPALTPPLSSKETGKGPHQGKKVPLAGNGRPQEGVKLQSNPIPPQYAPAVGLYAEPPQVAAGEAVPVSIPRRRGDPPVANLPREPEGEEGREEERANIPDGLLNIPEGQAAGRVGGEAPPPNLPPPPNPPVGAVPPPPPPQGAGALPPVGVQVPPGPAVPPNDPNHPLPPWLLEGCQAVAGISFPDLPLHITTTKYPGKNKTPLQDKTRHLMLVLLTHARGARENTPNSPSHLNLEKLVFLFPALFFSTQTSEDYLSPVHSLDQRVKLALNPGGMTTLVEQLMGPRYRVPRVFPLVAPPIFPGTGEGSDERLAPELAATLSKVKTALQDGSVSRAMRISDGIGLPANMTAAQASDFVKAAYEPHTPPCRYEALPGPTVPTHPSSNYAALPPGFTYSTFDKAVKHLKGGGSGVLGMRDEHAKMLNRDPALSLELYKFALAVSRDELATEVRPFLNHLESKPVTKPNDPNKLRPITPPSWWWRMPASCMVKELTSKIRGVVGESQFGIGNPGGVETVITAIRMLRENPSNVIVALDLKNCFGEIPPAHALDLLLKYNLPELIPLFNLGYGYQDNPLMINTVDEGKILLGPVGGFYQGDPLAVVVCALVVHDSLQTAYVSAPLMKVEAVTTCFVDDCHVTGKLAAPGEGGGIIHYTEVFCRALHAIGKAIVSPKSKVLSREVLSADLAWSMHTAVSEGRPQGERNLVPKAEFVELYTAEMRERRFYEGPYCSFYIDGIVVLGAPVGTHPYMVNVIRSNLEAIQASVTRVSELHDPQVTVLLSRFCLSKQVGFLTRNTPPQAFEARLTELDNHIANQCLQSAYAMAELPNELARPLSLARDVLASPVRDGGFGITPSAELAGLAFLAAQMEAIGRLQTGGPGGGVWSTLLRPIIDACMALPPPPIDPTLPHSSLAACLFDLAATVPPLYLLAQGVPLPLPLSLPRDLVGRKKTQSFFQQLFNNIRMRRVLHNLPPAKKATLLSAGGPGGSCFKVALPADNNTTLEPAVYSYLMRRNLLDENPLGVPAGMQCGCGADDSGHSHHLEMCKAGSAGVIGVHDAVTGVLRAMLSSAGCPVSPGEPRGVFQKQDGSYSHGGCDIAFYEDGPLGRRTFGDVSRTNESSPHAVSVWHSNVKAGNAAAKRAAEKRIKFAAPCQLLNTVFLPLTLEIGGHVGKDLDKLISRCARKVENVAPVHAPFSANTFRKFWLQQITLVSQVGAVMHAMRRRRDLVLAPGGVGGVGAGVVGVGVGVGAP